MITSKRLQEIPPSGTVAISNLVSKMKAEGADIVSFSMGEPDFSTPSNIADACVESLRSGFTHYTPSTGIRWMPTNRPRPWCSWTTRSPGDRSV